MSAKEELIAAALTAADLMEGMIGESYRPVGAALREACARAIAPPNMAEVERLLHEHEEAVILTDRGADYDPRPEKTRDALFAYVRGLLAGGLS